MTQTISETNINNIKRIIGMLRPGMTLDLMLNTPTTTHRVKTEFVGSVGNQFVIFRYPSEKRWGFLGEAIKEGKEVLVRFLLEDDQGEVVAFKSTVICISSQPTRLVHIDFPFSLQQVPLRQLPRVRTLLPAELHFDGADGIQAKDWDGMIIDISLKGARFAMRARDSMPDLKDRDVELNISAKEHFRLKGKVCNQKSEFNIIYFGIEFYAAEEQIHQLFDKLLIDIDLMDWGALGITR